jgi:hypothetical protein
MRRPLALLSLLALSLIVFGCSEDQPLAPQSSPVDDLDGAKCEPDLVPGGFYSFRWEEFAYSGFELINTRNGEASVKWTIGLTPEEGVTPLGLAFDLDGSMYTTLNFMSEVPEECYSQFAKVDPLTGAVTPIGPTLGMNTCGPEIDLEGNFFTCGMDVPMLGYIHGDGYLYKFNKMTGAYTRLPVYSGMTDWMDLACDAQGRLWATTQNKLFRLNKTTGEGTFVTDIHGVPDAAPPRNMEVMSIAFDKHNQLYATAMTTLWDDPNGSPVMKINTNTGHATLLGYTHQYYNHGGDTYPTRVRIAHRRHNGHFQPMTINIEALPAHLAHGDYVPGTVGDPNYPH